MRRTGYLNPVRLRLRTVPYLTGSSPTDLYYQIRRYSIRWQEQIWLTEVVMGSVSPMWDRTGRAIQNFPQEAPYRCHRDRVIKILRSVSGIKHFWQHRIRFLSLFSRI